MAKKGLGIISVLAGAGAVVFGIVKLLGKGKDDTVLTAGHDCWDEEETDEDEADSEN